MCETQVCSSALRWPLDKPSPHSSQLLSIARGEYVKYCVLMNTMEVLNVMTLLFQIFPDPSDFDRYCKLKDRLPSIVVEPTEGDVESGELRWPPEEFLVQEEEEEHCDEAKKESKEQ